MEGFQLSPQQRHLWSFHQTRNDHPYHASCVARVEGHLDLDTLRAAMSDLSDRHEILRTTFQQVSGMGTPVQVVADKAEFPLETEDLSALNGAERARAEDAFFQEARRLNGDRAEAPMWRTRLIALSENEHRLLIDAVALCSDGAGLAVMVAEIGRCYRARLQEESLKDPPLQYADGAAWLNELLSSEAIEPGRRFWRAQDLSALPDLALPFAIPSSGESDFDLRRLSPVGIPAEIESAARKYDVTPAVFLLTCWQCVLQRLSLETRLLVSYRYDVRGFNEELENAMGLFAKFLPLDGDLPLDLPFSDALKRVETATENAKKWGECFDWDALSGLDRRQPPFFPFAFEEVGGSHEFRAGDVTFTVERRYDCIDRFKLKLSYCPTRDPAIVGLEYDRSHYREEDVARLGEQLVALVNDAVARPEAPLGALQMTSAAERRPVTFKVGGKVHDLSGSECLHHLFEAQVVRTPQRIAVVCGDQQLTYEGLNGRANLEARRLKELGIGPESLVALSVERSVDLLVGIFGILKAGAAYVPLDPSLPSARARSMLESTRAPVIVTQEHLIERLPTSGSLVVALGARGGASEGEQADNVDGGVRPENLAYVLFTSGSTGTPKGVAVEHRQLVNYVRAMEKRLEPPSGASYATVSTFAADLGNTAIFLALSTGGCLHVVAEDCASDPEAFGSYMQRHQIDVLKIVPSHLQALLSSSQPARVLPRQRLVLGGEACTWSLVDEIQKLAPACVVFNHYGPTETTIGVTAGRLPAPGGDTRHETPPIGRPIQGVRAYVLDRYRQPVPFWVPGELHVGGACVTRGYINDEQLTAERFIADPFLEEAGARIYRTGDRVRLLPSGELEFLGRWDEQVKIRGFRVELGEVAGAIRAREAVREAVVVVREDTPGDKRLVAYVVPAEGTSLDADHLRVSLKQELPEYMVPSALVPLRSLPLTPNGKLDRAALPDPAQELGSRRDTDTPGSPWESIITEVWSHFLRVDEVGPHDNFYDLGGHSLLAIQVVTALEKRTGVQVTPRELVFHTLRQFAAVCESQVSSPPVRSVVQP